jgi:polysaccharide biosynthesis protein PslG
MRKTLFFCLLVFCLKTLALGQSQGDFGPRPVSRFVPAIPREAIGINMHPERFDDKTAEMHFLKTKEMGIGQIRVNSEWCGIEPKKGEWNFSEVDRTVKLAKKYNMKILFVLSYNTPWNESFTGNPALVNKSKPKDMNAWREFVRRMAERYKKDIIWWEIWNEQNDWLAGPYDKYPQRRWTDYREIIQAAYETLKAVNPENLVAFGGIAHSNDDWWKVLEAYYRVGAPKFCDVMAIHPYPGGANPLDNQWYPRYIEEILAVMAKHGDAKKPLWITEVGSITAPKATNLVVTEQLQADYLADLLLVPLSRHQVQKIFYFAVWDDEGHGLYRKNWTPKPAALRMKQLLNQP